MNRPMPLAHMTSGRGTGGRPTSLCLPSAQQGESAMYTLYYAPGAASMLPHLALLETGAPYELKLVDTAAKQHKSAEYLKLNPNGVIPTLVADGAPMAEAAAMALLLAERHPEAKLAPAPGSPQRAAFLQWMLHFANTLQPTF